ncbi:hypothetical protein ACWCOV_40265 [Kribbella sp. NPDC002412]
MGPDGERHRAGLAGDRRGRSRRRERLVALAGAGLQCCDRREPAFERHTGGQLQVDAALGGEQVDLTAMGRIQDGQEVGDGIFGTDNGEDVNHPGPAYATSLPKVVERVSIS